MQRVVITGIGAVTPLAPDFRGSWNRMLEGASGLARAAGRDLSSLPWSVVGEVKGFDPSPYLSEKERRQLDPFIHYALAAAVMAAEDAGLLPHIPEERARSPRIARSGESSGVIIGSSRGGIGTLERALHASAAGRRPSPFLMPATTISMAASIIAQKLRTSGVCLGISTACASGANAVGEAFRMIRSGQASRVFAGGTEAPLCRIGVSGYGSSGALSRLSDASASRPFDRQRDGFVLAEGAAVLVLEEYHAARLRNAPVYAEIIGYSTLSDGHHLTRPQREGEARAISAALDDAGVGPEAVDYINAHATSTPLGDRTEAEALHQVFGRRAARLPVSALKSMTGHMLAASGAFEIACTAMSLKEEIIPPTINLSEKDPSCDLNVITEPSCLPMTVALSSSFGFGGINAVLALKK
ncbi:MAG: beta-ketoacyl-ACP synthase II [Nitrospirota bacterium]